MEMDSSVLVARQSWGVLTFIDIRYNSRSPGMPESHIYNSEEPFSHEGWNLCEAIPLTRRQSLNFLVKTPAHAIRASDKRIIQLTPLTSSDASMFAPCFYLPSLVEAVCEVTNLHPAENQSRRYSSPTIL